MKCLAALFALSCAILAMGIARAEDRLKIGAVLTLSGPSAVMGTHQRDGFALALRQRGGRLGGREAEVIIVDDELKPDIAVQKVRALIERDQVDLITGVTFSNILLVVARPVFEKEIFLIGSNAGTSVMAGKACSPFFFTTSSQNDQIHELMGTYATRRGMKRIVLIAPNYQAGKDAIAGFKRTFSGTIADELMTPLGALDFSPEIAKVAALKPDAVFTFMPGGMGVNLVRQYDQAGLRGTVPLLSAGTIDDSTLPAMGEAARDLISVAQWTADLDTPANHGFVRDFEAMFGYVPSFYAQQGYDAALLIDAALRATGGNLKDKKALRRAFLTAEISSPRGPFRMNTNGFPVQDFHLLRPVKRPDGRYVTSAIEKAASMVSDSYAHECPLK
jgi:branched-chain amino acid transport system substrate-binding protein